MITLQEDSRFFVEFPAIQEAFTEGETFKEALLNAFEVLNLSLEGRLEDGLEIPPPDIGPLHDYLITPNANIQSALLIYFHHQNQSVRELSSILGDCIQDIKNPKKNNLTVSELEKIAHTIGKQLVIDFA
jgi:antitoxin HicB